MSKPDTAMPAQTMSAAQPVTILKPATSEEVRSKFFNILGLDATKSPTFAAATPPKSSQVFDKDWKNPRHQTARFEESLKYNHSDDRRYSPKRKPAEKVDDSSNTAKTKKRISFDDKVNVVPIPMRDEYSNRVRSRLWSNALEIHENAHRNSLEFAAEGWDWKGVLEDDYMLRTPTGELIHPIHAMRPAFDDETTDEI